MEGVSSATVEVERCLPLQHCSPSPSCQIPASIFGHGDGFPATDREKRKEQSVQRWA